MNVEKELAALKRMTPAQLREKYAEVFGEESRSGHKEWLIKRIIWRLQANAEGGLSERAKRRALELANEADLRLKAPRESKVAAASVAAPGAQAKADRRVPLPGSVITRIYKGENLQVHVRREGFEYEGEFFKSLSAVAKRITGSHCNGYLFFRLTGSGR